MANKNEYPSTVCWPSGAMNIDSGVLYAFYKYADSGIEISNTVTGERTLLYITLCHATKRHIYVTVYNGTLYVINSHNDGFMIYTLTHSGESVDHVCAKLEYYHNNNDRLFHSGDYHTYCTRLNQRYTCCSVFTILPNNNGRIRLCTPVQIGHCILDVDLENMQLTRREHKINIYIPFGIWPMWYDHDADRYYSVFLGYKTDKTICTDDMVFVNMTLATSMCVKYIYKGKMYFILKDESGMRLLRQTRPVFNVKERSLRYDSNRALYRYVCRMDNRFVYILKKINDACISQIRDLSNNAVYELGDARINGDALIGFMFTL